MALLRVEVLASSKSLLSTLKSFDDFEKTVLADKLINEAQELGLNLKDLKYDDLKKFKSYQEFNQTRRLTQIWDRENRSTKYFGTGSQKFYKPDFTTRSTKSGKSSIKSGRSATHHSRRKKAYSESDYGCCSLHSPSKGYKVPETLRKGSAISMKQRYIDFWKSKQASACQKRAAAKSSSRPNVGFYEKAQSTKTYNPHAEAQNRWDPAQVSAVLVTSQSNPNLGQNLNLDDLPFDPIEYQKLLNRNVPSNNSWSGGSISVEEDPYVVGESAPIQCSGKVKNLLTQKTIRKHKTLKAEGLQPLEIGDMPNPLNRTCTRTRKPSLKDLVSLPLNLDTHLEYLQMNRPETPVPPKNLQNLNAMQQNEPNPIQGPNQVTAQMLAQNPNLNPNLLQYNPNQLQPNRRSLSHKEFEQLQLMVINSDDDYISIDGKSTDQYYESGGGESAVINEDDEEYYEYGLNRDNSDWTEVDGRRDNKGYDTVSNEYQNYYSDHDVL